MYSEGPLESSPDRYFNLKLHPDLVLNIPKARERPELSAFLSRVNASGFPVETGKCDVWFDQELSAEEEIFGAQTKFVCYVDLLFSDETQRFSLAAHEQLAEDVFNLKRTPEMAAAAEFIVRHCHYHQDNMEKDGDRKRFQHWLLHYRLCDRLRRHPAGSSSALGHRLEALTECVGAGGS